MISSKSLVSYIYLSSQQVTTLAPCVQTRRSLTLVWIQGKDNRAKRAER
jgi:hypothetical protein